MYIYIHICLFIHSFIIRECPKQVPQGLEGSGRPPPQRRAAAPQSAAARQARAPVRRRLFPSYRSPFAKTFATTFAKTFAKTFDI